MGRFGLATPARGATATMVVVLPFSFAVFDPIPIEPPAVDLNSSLTTQCNGDASKLNPKT
jgi:hypothetical protein